MNAPDDYGGESGRHSSLQWHILGGNNKSNIGANCGLCVYSYFDKDGVQRQKALLFDAGALPGSPRSPEDPVLTDSDIVIPDLSRFLYKADDPAYKPEIAIDTIFLTHNHGDHTGAIPLLILMGYKMPKIYATPYTAKRLQQELSNAGLDPSEWPQIYTIAPGTPVAEGPVSVTAFCVSHSTPQSVGFFIETPEGNLLNPGDFKLDQTVLWGPAFDAEQFRRIVSKPVDLLLLDSTGADSDIAPVTEEDVRETLRDLIAEHPNKRFVVAVMAGYEENLASVAQVTAECGRTLWVAGSAHEQTLSALNDTGMSLSDHVGQQVDLRVVGPGKASRDLAAARPKDSVVVVTGTQGHANAALTRAVEGHHNALHLDPKTDVIVLCAPSMRGQEAQRERMLSSLRGKGFKVFTRQDAPLYSHSHARLTEIIDFVKMADPQHILPIHGSKELRDGCASAMTKMGKKVVQADSGDVIEVSKAGVKSVESKTKGHPPLIGLKTLQGANWNDRYYLTVRVPQEDTARPQQKALNNNRKHRPKFFDFNTK